MMSNILPVMYQPSPFDPMSARTLGLDGNEILEAQSVQGQMRCVTCGAPVDPEGGFVCPQENMAACSWDCASMEDDAYNTHFPWREMRGNPMALRGEPMPEGGGFAIGGLWVAAGLALLGYAFLVRPSKRGK